MSVNTLVPPLTDTTTLNKMRACVVIPSGKLNLCYQIEEDGSLSFAGVVSTQRVDWPIAGAA